MIDEMTENQKIAGESKFNFLSDAPLTADQEQLVRFGHIGIAENLRRIILECPTPFTMGLFGKWGTGKTTVLNLLKDKLKDGNIAVASFDVWKHEGDALRRTFLKQITNQLKEAKRLLNNFELSERLDWKISREFQGRFRLNRLALKPLIIFSLFLIGISVLILLLWPRHLGLFLSIMLGAVGSGTFLLWILQQAVATETITHTSDRLQDPYEFEAEFKNIVKELSSEKLLVIIDNLDRASHGKAVELLSTVKTFLEQKKCVFLIACDDEAIKKHLESVYTSRLEQTKNQTSFSADEFLRKFFNAFQRIPDFIDTELYTYTELLLRETKVPQFDSSHVAFVITSAFRDNPRQIKQFINVLLAHFLLANERENGENPLIVPKGAVTNNIAFLAKFLVIYQQFSDIYQIITINHLMWGEIETFNFVEAGVDKGQVEKFRTFMKATRWVTVDNIRPFHYLKQSEEELSIPEIDKLKIALFENEEEVVKEEISKLTTNQLKNFGKIVIGLIDRNKSRRNLLYNIVSSCLTSIRHSNKALVPHFYNAIGALLNDDELLGPVIERFEPLLVFDEVLGRCHSGDRKGIIDRYIRLLTTPKKPGELKVDLELGYVQKLFKELIEHKDLFEAKQSEAISKAISNLYYSYEILSLFKNKPEVQKDFISEEAICKFVSSFSDKDIENKQISEKTETFLSLKGIITPKAASDVISKLRDLLNTERQKAYREEKENLLNCIENILGGLGEKIGMITDQSVINSFADSIIQGVNALGNYAHKKIFVLTCYWLVDMLKDAGKKSQIETLLSAFSSSADVESIKFALDKLDKKEQERLITKYEGNLRQRVTQQPFFDLLYPLAPKGIRTQWLIYLISSASQQALTILDGLSYNVDDKIATVDALLNKVPQAAVPEKESLYNAVHKMGCAGDKNLMSVFASQIKGLLKSTDSKQQECGYNAFKTAVYFPETTKRDIATDTIEWLRSLQPSTAGQTYAIYSILLNWKILDPTPQRDFVHFIFDKLIRRGPNTENIKLGFEALFQVKPDYENYSKNFDDVFARIESESNLQIKSEILVGLAKLRPEKTDKRNKNFWEKVDDVFKNMRSGE